MPGIGIDVGALREDPGQRDLPGCDTVGVGDLADGVDRGEVGVERLALEAGVDAPHVALGQFVVGGDPAGEEAATRAG